LTLGKALASALPILEKSVNRDPIDTSRVHHQRLGRLTDVVYAIALATVIQWLPYPSESLAEGDVWLIQLFADHANNMVAVLIGLVFIILYWVRSNTLLSALDRTDGVHTGLSIASVFFLLFLLYIVRVSAELSAPSRRAGESVAVLLIGVAAGAAWWWARRKRLTREGLTREEQTSAQLEAFAEPLVALITLPLAYVGDLAWNLAWLAYFPVAAILRRRGNRTV
jgi:hypothetical protein